VLTAALALVALPGLAGSQTPSPVEPVPAVALQALTINSGADPSPQVIGPLDPVYRSASYIQADETLVEPAADTVPAGRAKAQQAQPSAVSAWKPPRYEVSGYATWYNNGTTAMRLPRGTTVVICGDGGCVERTVTDYGPIAGHIPVRVVDLTPGDFVATCGCALWKGTHFVTVKVY
jgi:hypothetical protein